MYNTALYELYSAAKMSLPNLDRLNYDNLNSLLGIENFIQEFESQEINQLNSRELRSKVALSMDLLRDRILLTNNGLSSNETLGTIWYNCQKDIIIYTLFLRRGYYRAGLALVDRSVSICKKHHFNELIVSFLKLGMKFAYFTGKMKKYETYHRQLIQYQKYENIEFDLFVIRNELMIELDHSHSLRADVVHKISSTIEMYSPYKDQIPSTYFHYGFFHLSYIFFIAQKKYEKVLINAREALNWFNRNSKLYFPGILTFNLHIIEYHIYKKDFVRALKQTIELEVIPDYLTMHHMRKHEMRFLINLHDGNWNESYDIFRKIRFSTYHSSLEFRHYNRVLLYEAYVQILIDAGQFKPENKSRFRVQKFLNSLPDYAKDKEVMNISLIIAKFCFLVVRKKYTDCLQYAEALEKYKQRHLRKFYHERCRTFLKMLIAIPKNGFNQKSVIRKTDKLLNELNEIPLDIFYVPIQIEIIPYEKLWKVVVNSLSNRHYYRQQKLGNQRDINMS